jgi:hypothetical protein
MKSVYFKFYLLFLGAFMTAPLWSFVQEAPVQLKIHLDDKVIPYGQQIPLKIIIKNLNQEKLVLPSLDPDYLAYQATHQGSLQFKLQRLTGQGGQETIEAVSLYKPQYDQQTEKVIIYKDQSVRVKIDLNTIYKLPSAKKAEHYQIYASFSQGNTKILSNYLKFKVLPTAKVDPKIGGTDADETYKLAAKNVVAQMLQAYKNENWAKHFSYFNLVKLMKNSYPKYWQMYQATKDKRSVLEEFKKSLIKTERFGNLQKWGEIKIQPEKETNICEATVELTYKRLRGTAFIYYNFRQTYTLEKNKDLNKWEITKLVVYLIKK